MHCPKSVVNDRWRNIGTKVLRSFFRRVTKYGDCMIASGFQDPGGHTRIGRKPNRLPTHVFAWELIRDPVPKGLQLRHICNRPNCVNPFHLLLGTAADNYRDSIETGKRRKK